MAARYSTPILVSELHTAPLISRLSAFLYQYFARKIRMNGVLMDIMGQGVLITGASGIGKSETALELVNKGYQLIADDVTEFYLDSNDDLVGRANEIIKNLMEVRGLGIININDIFGASAVLEEKKLNLVINLEKWDAQEEIRPPGRGQPLLQDPRPRSAADQPAGRPGAQPVDHHRGGAAQLPGQEERPHDLPGGSRATPRRRNSSPAGPGPGSEVR